MKTTMFALPLMLVLSTSTFAQDTRTAPAKNDPRPFVEQADPGAFGNFQIIRLKGLRMQVNPYATPGPKGNCFAEEKTVNDFAIYDPSTGSLLLATADLATLGMMPTIATDYQLVQIRPNLVLTAIELDGDGRDDMIGHDRLTGEVVRFYRRGSICR